MAKSDEATNPAKLRKFLPLKKLGPKHLLMAHMLVKGQTNLEVAAQLGWTPNYVSQLRCNPLVRACIEKLQDERNSRSVVALDKMIEEQAIPSFNKIVSLRDHASDQRLQKDCAVELLERAKPKLKPADTRPAVVVQIDARTLELMHTAVKEDDAQ